MLHMVLDVVKYLHQICQNCDTVIMSRGTTSQFYHSNNSKHYLRLSIPNYLIQKTPVASTKHDLQSKLKLTTLKTLHRQH